MAGYAGLSGSVRLTPPNWLNQRKSRNTATNKHTNASEEPQAVQVPRSGPSAAVIPCAKTSANVGVRGNAATNKLVSPVQYDPDREKK